jgi:amidase
VEETVANAVREVLGKLQELGAEVGEISVPEHLDAAPIAFGFYLEATAALLGSGGNGYHWKGRYMPDLAIALGEGIKVRGDALPPTIKAVTLVGTYLRERYFGSLYAKAQNLRPALTAAYDRALGKVDFLVMPTTPMPAFKHEPDLSTRDRVLRGWSMLGNVPGMDLSGHPALSMPAAQVDGLPLGMMAVGKRFGDAELLAFARTYEKSYGWFPSVRTK